MCLDCGLFYLMDRLTDEGYAEFYSAGHYRELTHAFNGGQTLGEIQADQDQYANELVAALNGYVSTGANTRLLDIGGSAGRIALRFQKFFGITACVLDPSADEIAAALRAGLEGIIGSIEQWSTTEKFDLILICRSIEHFQDLRGALTKTRSLLRPDGLLFCDVVDFAELCRSIGHPEAVSKIDHCFWVTRETAARIFRSIGFEVISINVALQRPLMGYLLRPCEPSAPEALDTQWIHRRLSNLREIGLDWQDWGRHPYDAEDWLRRKAYPVKRRLANLFRSP